MKEVVFVLWQEDSGIFVDAAQYDRVTKIEYALAKAKTWGEFKKLMPPGEFEEISDWLSNDGEYIFEEDGIYLFIQPSELAEFMSSLGEEHIIHASEKFDKYRVHGVADGVYPCMNYHTCDENFPDTFVKKYGIFVGSPGAGAWTEYPLDKLKKMTTDLKKLGFEVTEDLSMQPY